MKTPFKIILIGSAVLSMSILVVEFIYTNAFMIDLKNNETGFPANSFSNKLAKNDKTYFELETKGVEKRLERLKMEFLAWVCLFCIPFIFFLKKVRNTLLNFCDQKLTILKSNAYDIPTKEVNFICVIIVLLIYGSNGNWFFAIMDEGFKSTIAEIIFYIFIFCVLLPFSVILVYNMFRIYGSTFIIACYIAYYIKAISEFLSQDEVDLKAFQKVDPTAFSEKVQQFLKEQDLLNKVYKEKQKSDSINAALVGWGGYEHIEIYGDHGTFSDEEFEAVLMHEIGHSKDYSLYKKVAVLFLLKAIEMTILLVIYKKTAESFSDENISIFGSFIILYALYQTFLYRYLMAFHKLTSQSSETAADIIARDHGFGKALARVLFKITVSSSEYLPPTFLYNAIKSYHPSIFSRVEYLNIE